MCALKTPLNVLLLSSGSRFHVCSFFLIKQDYTLTIAPNLGKGCGVGQGGNHWHAVTDDKREKEFYSGCHVWSHPGYCFIYACIYALGASTRGQRCLPYMFIRWLPDKFSDVFPLFCDMWLTQVHWERITETLTCRNRSDVNTWEQLLCFRAILVSNTTTGMCYYCQT